MVPSAKGSFEMLCGRWSLLPFSYLLPVTQLCGLTTIILKVFFDTLCHKSKSRAQLANFSALCGIGGVLGGLWLVAGLV